MTETLAGKALWLDDPDVVALFAALVADGGEARVVGGAVRNTLMGRAVADIDFATTHRPEATIRLVEAAGFRAVPTGIDHGTVMAVRDGRGFEVTTLRADIATDGRHATVAFGVDWEADARRRDFTINALYAKADGTVIDHVGGLADIGTATLRFIGDAEARIREDYLRILRFFRFFAQYGRGRPDADGIRACAKLKDGLSRLSAERVWSELKKLLSADDPGRALLWMRQAGVLGAILPETEKWGIDAVPALVDAKAAFGWPADPLLMVEAITPPDPARRNALAERLRLSSAEKARLVGHALQPVPDAGLSEAGLAKALYRGTPQALSDHLRLALAAARAMHGPLDPGVLKIARHMAIADNWQRPHFPVSGDDLKGRGHDTGPAMGVTLKRLETVWVDSGFSLSRDDLLALA